MATDFNSIPSTKSKSFWKRPEGVAGAIGLIALLAGGGFLLYTFLPALIVLVQNTLYLALLLLALGAILYMVLDPRMRNLIWYMYKSVMRWITGVFVTIDPIGILKNYVEDLEDNLQKMSKQIGQLRGQMRRLKTTMEENTKEIENNMLLAKKAKEQGNERHMLLSSRKAARLKDSNEKYQNLHNKMEILYRVLTKMYQNSEILLDDTKDQVKLKEQERKAIRASHSAMKNAIDIISGSGSKRAMFDQALESIADDLANKVGEMERFMEMSTSFMDSIDLQSGVFEEQGIKMLEEWEKKSTLMLLGDGRTKSESELDLDEPRRKPEKLEKGGSSGYENLFED
jgi:phage shock protein A